MSLDAAWHYTGVNDAGLDVIGTSRDEVIGRSLWEVCPWMRGLPKADLLQWAMEHRRPVAGRFKSALRVGLFIMLTAVPAPRGGIDVVWKYSGGTQARRSAPSRVTVAVARQQR